MSSEWFSVRARRLQAPRRSRTGENDTAHSDNNACLPKPSSGAALSASYDFKNSAVETGRSRCGRLVVEDGVTWCGAHHRHRVGDVTVEGLRDRRGADLPFTAFPEFAAADPLRSAVSFHLFFRIFGRPPHTWARMLNYADGRLGP